MLRRFAVRGFKSLRDIEIEMRPLSVFLGPNAAGKSNFLDAIQVFSRIGSHRTLGDAMNGNLRGFPLEAFSFPPGGFPTLLDSPSARFEFDTDLTTDGNGRYRYAVSVEINCRSGALSSKSEHLAPLSANGAPKRSPVIETEGENVLVRQRGNRRPRKEPIGRPFTALSDLRLAAPDHEHIERVRDELSGWRAYCLDPRVAMRTQWPPMDVRDIGMYGQHLAPYLFRLRHEFPRHFDSVRRTLRTVVTGVDDFEVHLDKASGDLELWFIQDGIRYSSRVVSEGTLRVLALAILAVDPWAGPLVAFEEPDSGVHPRRVEMIANMIHSLTVERQRQVVVATHSPLFCDALLRRARNGAEDIGLFALGRDGESTQIRQINLFGPLFRDPEIRKALTSDEDGVFESLFLRGIFDG